MSYKSNHSKTPSSSKNTDMNNMNCVKTIINQGSIALFLWIGLLMPWLHTKLEGISQIPFNEESIGYRYFHSLRLVYGNGEYPWLPQGQLPGLLHIMVQKLLTILGYPINNVDSRIESFIDYTILFQSTFIACAFLFGLSVIKSWSLRLCAASIFVIASYTKTSLHWGMYLMTPDYMAWVLIASFIMVGMVIRHETQIRATTIRDFIFLGIFSGLCIGTKTSYFLFPFVVWITLMLDIKDKRLYLIGNILCMMIALVSFFLIILAYYQFNFKASWTHLEALIFFLNNSGSDSFSHLAWEWATKDILSWPIQFITISMLLPALYLISGLFFRNLRKISFILFIGAALSTVFSWKRFYAVTHVETNAFTAASIVIYAYFAISQGKKVNLAFLRENYLPGKIVASMMVILLCATAYTNSKLLPLYVFHAMSLSDKSDKALHQFLRNIPGKTLFVIPNNELRPLTIDSAIYKGASDVHHQYWGHSPLMVNIFSDRWYLFGNEKPGNEKNPPLKQFHKIVFAYFPPNHLKTQQLLKTEYGIDLKNFTCPFNANTGNASIIVGCIRN